MYQVRQRLKEGALRERSSQVTTESSERVGNVHMKEKHCCPALSERVSAGNLLWDPGTPHVSGPESEVQKASCHIST